MKKSNKKVAPKSPLTEEQKRELEKAVTLDMDELGWVHGGSSADACCCSWRSASEL